MHFGNEKFTILFLTIAFAGVMISLLYMSGFFCHLLSLL